MHLSRMCLLGLFGLVFAVAARGAVTTVVSQPFATATTDLATLTSGSWSGDGAVTNIAATQTIAVGKPVGGADTGVLAVEGKILCTGANDAALTSGSTPTSVDMLIQIAKPDDALEALTEEGVKFAVGVESDGTIKAFCGPKSGSGNAWRTLISTPQEEGTWHRVSLRFDYSSGVCEVVYDGDPVVSAYGWLTPAKAGDANGSWYPLAGSSQGLTSVQVVGTTAIDEVLVKTGTLDEVSPEPTGSVADGANAGVTRAWLVKNGISAATTTAPDGSGMSVKDKFLTGVSPTSGEKFEVKAMAMSGAAGAVKATLTIPAMTPAAGYKNVVMYGTAPNELNNSVDITTGSTSVTVDVAKGEGTTVLYYQIQTVPAS